MPELQNALRTLYLNSKYSAKDRRSKGRIEAGQHNISFEFVNNLWLRQNGRCYYSNIPMNYNKNEWKVSMERLDTSKGYIEDNVVLCCLEFNSHNQWTAQKIQEMMSIYEHGHEFDYKQIDWQSYTTGDKTIYEMAMCKLNAIVSHAKTNSKSRNMRLYKMRSDIDIDKRFLLELYINQQGRCAYSGIPLQFGSYKDMNWTVSLERINPMKGYTKDNVCLICNEFNTFDRSATSIANRSYGHSGWNALKFQYFLAHVQHMNGLISKEELDMITSMQDVTLSYGVKQVSTTKRTYNVLETYKERTGMIYAKLNEIRKTYGEIVLITLPKIDKQFIMSVNMPFRDDETILSNVKKNCSDTIVNVVQEEDIHKIQIDRIAVCKKEDLDKYRQYFIDMFDTRLPKGLNGQRQLTKETKDKISQSLIEATERFDHQQNKLPKYMKYVDWKDRKGYAIVSHPGCKLKYFVSKKKNLTDLYNNCLKYLQELDK